MTEPSHRIEVYGTGCSRCRATVARVEAALSEVAVPATVRHVTDIDVMTRAGVRALPAVSVDGRIVHTGTVPTRDQVLSWLASAVSQKPRSPVAPPDSAHGGTMMTLRVYDPALCCSTGVCGPTVDPDLARFAGDVEWLKSKGVSVERFNLAQQPAAFVEPTVKSALETVGEGALPLVQVGSTTVATGHYPSREVLAKLLGVAVEDAPKSSCCGPSTPSKGSSCC